MSDLPPPTLLVVDDSEANRYAITRILSTAGFRILEAANGQEALELVRQKPDLIVLDVKLPDMSGYEVCRQIRSDPATASIPILHISASYVRAEDQVKGLEEGADGYLVQPVERPVLVANIKALLRARRAEEALRASDERWQLAIRANNDGIWDWNLKTNEVFYSPRWKEMLGYSDGDIGNTVESWQELVHPEDLPTARALCRAHLDGECAALVAEMRMRHKDGSWRWILSRGMAIRDENGTPCRMVGSHTDVTAQREAEEALRRAKDEAEAASQAKDQFLAALSHELRTPLMPILATVQLLQADEESLPHTVREALTVIRRNTELEARLIDDLLDLTRIAKGKLQILPETLDAHALIHSALDICISDARAKQQRISLQLNAREHHVNADPARLQQVLWNLLKNAVKFTPAGGSITVRSKNPADGRLAIEVIDTGVGIDPQVLTHIFNAFEQGDKSRFGGLGLGLSISKALVDLHGGTLQAESAGRGAGATLRLELPTVAAPGRADAARQPSAARDLRPPSHKILLVEDHEDSIRAMSRILESFGYQVTPARTVAEALDALQNGDVDLLISDIGLPDGSGLDLMRHLRENARPVPAIALTGYGMEQDRLRCAEAGFCDHLTKPVNMQQLEAAIQRITSSGCSVASLERS